MHGRREGGRGGREGIRTATALIIKQISHHDSLLPIPPSLPQLSNCGKQIVDCQRNPACKAALACLESCPPNDQVCRYRCIVQYESTEFEQFALCILQKHNCLQNKAAIPMSPDPAPMTLFRGEPLTHAVAEEIQFGHLGGLQQGLPWSWKVISGGKIDGM